MAMAYCAHVQTCLRLEKEWLVRGIVGLLRPARHSIVPRPRPAFHHLQYEKAGRAWYPFSWAWHSPKIIWAKQFYKRNTREYVGYSWLKQHLEIYQITNLTLVSKAVFDGLQWAEMERGGGRPGDDTPLTSFLSTSCSQLGLGDETAHVACVLTARLQLLYSDLTMWV